MSEAIAAAVQEEREAVLACLHSGADWYCDDARNAIMLLAKEIERGEHRSPQERHVSPERNQILDWIGAWIRKYHAYAKSDPEHGTYWRQMRSEGMRYYHAIKSGKFLP